MPADSNASTEPIISRPKNDFYGFIMVVALAGLGMIAIAFFAWRDGAQAQKPLGIRVGLFAVFALFFVPCAYMLWLMRRLRIVADARGLEIRSAFKKQFIAWQNIEDYELRASPNTAATSRLSWICADSKWRRLPQLHGNMDALRAAIQTQATSSRAREWQLNVARDDADWPKTYAYRDPSGAKMFAIVAGGLALCVVLIFSTSGATTKPDGDALEKWLTIAAIFLPLLLAHFAIFRTRKRQQAPTLRADQNALSLADDSTPTRISWDEIADYGIEDGKGAVTMSQYVVEGAGKRLFFLHEITNFAELKALITARAVNAQSREWRHRESTDTDTIGGEPSLWTGGAPAIGRKVYHCRTRTLRAILALGGFFSLVFLVGYSSSLSWRTPEIGDLVAFVLFFLPSFILTVIGALAFWRASIQTDENGIFHCNVWGERFLLWDEIEAFTYNGYFYQIKGERTTIRYGLVAASESLQGEIETRADLKMRRTDRSENEA